MTEHGSKVASPTRHAHSHSHIGLPPLNPPPSLGSVAIARSGSTEGTTSTTGPVRYRASVDSNAVASANSGAGRTHQGALSAANASRWDQQKRPHSEYLGAGRKDEAEAQGSPPLDSYTNRMRRLTARTALDQWFNDLSHYEQTLEDMATAALDANFKEELSAIEQWFKVLSEAERTAALYSLLQTSTPVQMRFFVTVLQQMLKRDPVGQLLSPTNPLSMESQLESRLNAMGLKSPSPPSTRQSSRQSSTPSTETYLSPNMATSLRDSTTSSSDRSKLKSRTSAPANLLLGQSNGSDSSARWSERNAVPERRTPSPRLSINGDPIAPHSAAPQMTSFRESLSPREANMSPLAQGGSWSSLVQTPLAPMFGDSNTFGGLSSSPNLGSSATWGSPNGLSNANIVLDDPRKFRRSARVPSDGATSFGGALDGMYKSTSSSSSSRQRSPTGQGSSYPTSPYGNGMNRTSSPTASNHMAAQQAALSAQQNWRAAQAGLGAGQQSSSPSLRTTNEQTQQMAQLLALQQQLQIQQLNLAAAASLAALSPVQLLNMQQQQAAALLTPNRFGATFGQQQQQQQQSPQPNGMMPPLSPRRSPRSSHFPSNLYGSTNSSSKMSNAAAAPAPTGPLNNGTNADESIDMNLLNDVPSWLRSLRLHKYTTNFEKKTWQEMVKMDDAALEANGVLALGARRKLLKVFENVRINKGMALPGDGQGQSHSADANEGNEVTNGDAKKQDDGQVHSQGW